jgi:hypothetical protein
MLVVVSEACPGEQLSCVHHYTHTHSHTIHSHTHTRLHSRTQVDVVSQDSVAVLEGAYAVAGDRLVLLYMRDAYEQVRCAVITSLTRWI